METKTNFNSIDEVRKNIDMLDDQIVNLIAKRCVCVKAATQFKKNEDAVRAPDRVETVINQVKQKANELNLPESIIESVYRAMITSFINYELQQKKL